MKRGQNPKYEKSYFQGDNSKDLSFWIKTPSRTESKNIARKSKRKKRK